MRIVTCAIDEHQVCVGDSVSQLLLKFRRKDKVLPACYDQGGYLDLTEAILYCPTLEKMSFTINKRLGLQLRLYTPEKHMQ